jgi:hypothetical protein
MLVYEMLVTKLKTSTNENIVEPSQSNLCLRDGRTKKYLKKTRRCQALDGWKLRGTHMR